MNLTDVFKNTFLVCIKTSILTAFSFEYKGKQFLVTAQHALQYEEETGEDQTIINLHELNLDEEIEINVCTNLGWIPKKVRFVAKGKYQADIGASGQDVLVFAPSDCSWLSPLLLSEVAKNDMKIGAEIRFLGFPILGVEHSINENGYPIPLLRGGFLAGWTEECKDIFLDAHNCKGFSGGPVVFKDPIEGGLKVIGVISGFFHESVKKHNISNSGITICVPIGYVIELLDSYLSTWEKTF